MNHWLLKSEPDQFGIDDLAARPGGTDVWDGVRNYQARNFMREMKRGDRCFFYHSNCPQPGIVGIMRVVGEARPDPTALDPRSPYFDARSTPERPLWDLVELCFERRLRRILTLAELKADPALAGMHLVRRGSRLSVMPVTAEQWRHLLDLEGAEGTQ